MKPTTLDEALSMVPTHWMLTPGVDVWQKGDENMLFRRPGSDPVWYTVQKFNPHIGFAIESSCSARRPIPQDVRESFARILLNGAEIERTGVQAAFGAYAYEAWILAGKP